MNSPVDMKAAKARLQQKKYAPLVLDAFDDLKKSDDQKVKKLCAEVEQKARKRL